MRRSSPSRARWAGLALALSLFAPSIVAADHHKSLSDCTSFDQADKGESNVEMTIHNSCSVAVACDVTWRVVCVPGANKRRSVHPGAAKLTLEEGKSDSTEASAAVCGDASWAIDGIEWSCQEDHS
jgi:hypothetical protein